MSPLILLDLKVALDCLKDLRADPRLTTALKPLLLIVFYVIR